MSILNERGRYDDEQAKLVARDTGNYPFSNQASGDNPPMRAQYLEAIRATLPDLTVPADIRKSDDWIAAASLLLVKAITARLGLDPDQPVAGPIAGATVAFIREQIKELV